MAVELRVPAVGESITEVQLGTWLKREGEAALMDEPILEIETDKVSLQFLAPITGVLTRVLKQTGEAAAVGELIGYMEEVAAASADASGQVSPIPTLAPGESAEARDAAAPGVAPRIMPAAQRVLAETGLAASDVTATGPGGRLLKEDVQRHAAQALAPVAAAPAAAAPAAPAPAAPSPAPPPPPPASDSDGREEEVIAMTPLRARIAERLVQAQSEAALLTTFNEVDMGAVMELRKQHQESFTKRYGVKLGFMSFFVKAVVDALKQTPAVNARIREKSIVYHNYYDVGVAIGGGKGLVVPVLRDADRLSFAEIELAIAELAERAKTGRITLEELAGGTFTISNGGVYGSMLSTPIVNPPQSGILGLHAIQDRPVARDGQVVVRPMMYVALTYDHRIVDGREAVTFLRRIKDVIEQPSRMLLEV